MAPKPKTCVQCRVQKVRCSKTSPCERCSELGIKCRQLSGRRPGRKPAPPSSPEAPNLDLPSQTLDSQQQHHMRASVGSPAAQQGLGVARATPTSEAAFPHTQAPFKVARVAYAPPRPSSSSAVQPHLPAPHLAFCPYVFPWMGTRSLWGPQDEAVAYRAMRAAVHELHTDGQLDVHRAVCTMKAWAIESQKRGYDITQGLEGYLSALLGDTLTRTQQACPCHDLDPIRAEVDALEKGDEESREAVPPFAHALDDGCSAFCACVWKGDDGGGGKFEYVCNDVCASLYMTVEEMMQGFQNAAVVPPMVWGRIIAPENRPNFFINMFNYMLSVPMGNKKASMLLKCCNRHGTRGVCLLRLRYLVMHEGDYTCLALSFIPLPARLPNIIDPLAVASVCDIGQGLACDAGELVFDEEFFDARARGVANQQQQQQQQLQSWERHRPVLRRGTAHQQPSAQLRDISFLALPPPQQQCTPDRFGPWPSPPQQLYTPDPQQQRQLTVDRVGGNGSQGCMLEDGRGGWFKEPTITSPPQQQQSEDMCYGESRKQAEAYWPDRMHFDHRSFVHGGGQSGAGEYVQHVSGVQLARPAFEGHQYVGAGDGCLTADAYTTMTSADTHSSSCTPSPPQHAAAASRPSAAVGTSATSAAGTVLIPSPGLCMFNSPAWSSYMSPVAYVEPAAGHYHPCQRIRHGEEQQERVGPSEASTRAADLHIAASEAQPGVEGLE